MQFGCPTEVQNAVLRRFNFLGRAFAVVLRDSLMLPIPLSPAFFRLVLGKELTDADMPAKGCAGHEVTAMLEWTKELDAIDAMMDIDEGAGGGSGSEARATRRAALAKQEFTKSRLGLSYEMSFEDFLNVPGSERMFVDPLLDEKAALKSKPDASEISGAELCKGGQRKHVTIDNLREYVGLLQQRWFRSGLRRQVAAFRAGVSDVFPVDALLPFSGEELRGMVCGHPMGVWTRAAVMRIIQPTGGYT
jgi:hypothetical protein